MKSRLLANYGMLAITGVGIFVSASALAADNTHSKSTSAASTEPKSCLDNPNAAAPIENFLAQSNAGKNPDVNQVKQRLDDLAPNCFKGMSALNILCPRLQRDPSKFFGGGTKFGTTASFGGRADFDAVVAGSKLRFRTLKNAFSGNVITQALDESGNVVATFTDFATQDANGKIVREADGTYDQVELVGDAQVKNGVQGNAGTKIIPLNLDRDLKGFMGDALEESKANSPQQNLAARDFRDDVSSLFLKKSGFPEIANEKTTEQRCLGLNGDPARMLDYLVGKTGWNPNKQKLAWGPWLKQYSGAAWDGGSTGFVGFWKGTWDATGGAVAGLAQGLWKISTDPKARAQFHEVISAMGSNYDQVIADCAKELGVGVSVEGAKGLTKSSTYSQESFMTVMCAWDKVVRKGGAAVGKALTEGVVKCGKSAVRGTETANAEFGECMGKLYVLVAATLTGTNVASGGKLLSARAGMISARMAEGGAVTAARLAVVQKAMTASRALRLTGFVVGEGFGLSSGKHPLAKSEEVIEKISVQLGKSAELGLLKGKPTEAQIAEILNHLKEVALSAASKAETAIKPVSKDIEDLVGADLLATWRKQVLEAGTKDKAVLAILEKKFVEAHPEVKKLGDLSKSGLSTESQVIAKEIMASAAGPKHDAAALKSALFKIDKNKALFATDEAKQQAREVLMYLNPEKLKDPIIANNNLKAIKEVVDANPHMSAISSLSKFYSKSGMAPEAVAKLLNSFTDDAARGFSTVLEKAEKLSKANPIRGQQDILREVLKGMHINDTDITKMIPCVEACKLPIAL